MNIVRPDPFCEALFAPQRKGFRYGKILYTEDVGGSSPSSPTIKTLENLGFAPAPVLKIRRVRQVQRTYGEPK